MPREITVFFGYFFAICFAIFCYSRKSVIFFAVCFAIFLQPPRNQLFFGCFFWLFLFCHSQKISCLFPGFFSCLLRRPAGRRGEFQKSRQNSKKKSTDFKTANQTAQGIVNISKQQNNSQADRKRNSCGMGK